MGRWKVVKKSQLKAAAAPLAKGAGAPGDFMLSIDETGSGMVLGADRNGNPVDISQVATLTVASDNEAVLTVTATGGMGFKEDPLTPGRAEETFTVTWNDGSHGPFTDKAGVEVQAGGPQGLLVVRDPPTPKP